jgi:hypothetical protein
MIGVERGSHGCSRRGGLLRRVWTWSMRRGMNARRVQLRTPSCITPSCQLGASQVRALDHLRPARITQALTSERLLADLLHGTESLCKSSKLRINQGIRDSTSCDELVPEEVSQPWYKARILLYQVTIAYWVMTSVSSNALSGTVPQPVACLAIPIRQAVWVILPELALLQFPRLLPIVKEYHPSSSLPECQS